MPSLNDARADRIGVARAFLAAGNPRAAIREASRVLEADASDLFAFAALDVMAQAEYERRRYDQVQVIGERLVALQPQLANGRLYLAWAAGQRGDETTFDEMIAQGLQVDPSNVSLMVTASDRWCTRGDNRKAEAWARRALSIDPTNVTALATLAIAQSGSGAHSDAQTTIAQLQLGSPVDFAPLLAAAVDAYRRRDFQEAERLSVAALAVRPDHEFLQRVVKLSRFYQHPVLVPHWWLKRTFRNADRMSWVGFSVLCLVGIVVTTIVVRVLVPVIGPFWGTAAFGSLLVWLVGSAVIVSIGNRLVERSFSARDSQTFDKLR